MTNDDMWSLIRYRIRGFYERIFLPFGLNEQEGDFERAEEHLRAQFDASLSPSDWMINFLKGVEETETVIALHIKTPESFRFELDVSLKYVLRHPSPDSLNVLMHPPFLKSK